MNLRQLTENIEKTHANSRRAALHFCSHIPEEVLIAAGFDCIRLSHLEDFGDVYPNILPRNLCPVARECCAIISSKEALEADLIITESTCDGKKKMYELVPQDKLYYYQVAQGEYRHYAKPLIISEIRHLISFLEKKYNLTIDEQALREASAKKQQERDLIMSILAIQKQVPAPLYGSTIYAALSEALSVINLDERIERLTALKAGLSSQNDHVPKFCRRILLTGCPMAGVFDKVVPVLEENGGVVVYFENCDTSKPAHRKLDPEAPDIINAIAECYLHTGCAIMSPNQHRLEILEKAIREYSVEAVLDLNLQTCHAYTVETDIINRKCAEWGVHCMTFNTSHSPGDTAQLATRLAAFIETI